MSSTPSSAAPAASAAARPAPAADGADRLRGKLMAQSLMVLLDRVRGSREVLPHLAALERALMAKGAAAIQQIPVHWLTRMCSQLSSLPLPEQDPPLQDLMGRLLKQIELHHGPADDGGFDIERTVVVREVSHSEFEAAANEQATTLAGDVS